MIRNAWSVMRNLWSVTYMKVPQFYTRLPSPVTHHLFFPLKCFISPSSIFLLLGNLPLTCISLLPGSSLLSKRPNPYVSSFFWGWCVMRDRWCVISNAWSGIGNGWSVIGNAWSVMRDRDVLPDTQYSSLVTHHSLLVTHHSFHGFIFNHLL